jgi:hypothetical protein
MQTLVLGTKKRLRPTAILIFVKYLVLTHDVVIAILPERDGHLLVDGCKRVRSGKANVRIHRTIKVENPSSLCIVDLLAAYNSVLGSARRVHRSTAGTFVKFPVTSEIGIGTLRAGT